MSEGFKFHIFKCSRCRYTSPSLHFFECHVRRHSLQPRSPSCEKSILEQYSCNKCNFRTHFFPMLKEHVRNTCKTKQQHIENVIVYACDDCTFRSISTISSLLHMKNTTCLPKKSNGFDPVTGLYKCALCGYHTRRKADLRNHVICKHTQKNEINWMTCKNCHYEAKTKRQMFRHMARKHQVEDVEDSRWFRCTYCNHKTWRKFDLEKHVLAKHTPEEDITWFPCSDCDYRAKKKSDLERHIACRHTSNKEIKWFQCGQCNYRSKTRISLTKHISKALIEGHKTKRFDCPICTYKTKYNDGLEVHIAREHPKSYFEFVQC